MTSISPLLLVFMMASLLLLPVDYRAGARLPHPHTTFQLLAELATGSVHHHESAIHDAHAWSSTENPGSSAVATVTLAGSTLSAAPVARAQPPATVIAADDLPRLSALNPTVKFAIAPLLADPSTESFLDRLVTILDWSPALPLAAAVVTPEPPPPRAGGF